MPLVCVQLGRVPCPSVPLERAALVSHQPGNSTSPQRLALVVKVLPFVVEVTKSWCELKTASY